MLRIAPWAYNYYVSAIVPAITIIPLKAQQPSWWRDQWRGWNWTFAILKIHSPVSWPEFFIGSSSAPQESHGWLWCCVLERAGKAMQCEEFQAGRPDTLSSLGLLSPLYTGTEVLGPPASHLSHSAEPWGHQPMSSSSYWEAREELLTKCKKYGSVKNMVVWTVAERNWTPDKKPKAH